MIYCRQPADYRWLIVASLLVGLLCVAAGCAGSEMADEQPEAVAQAPASENDGAADDVDALTTAAAMIDDSLCEGGPCRICETGGQAFFGDDAADVAVRTCCDGAEECFSEIHFRTDATSIGLEGTKLRPADISSDSQWIVVSSKAEAQTAEEIFFVARDDLAELAGSQDEPMPVKSAEELRELSSWSLDAAELHSIEGLSARALEEAQTQCEKGHHLPTLVELSGSAAPLSERLQIEFERWVGPEQLLMSTRSEGPGWTTMIIDFESGCMQRYSTTEPWLQVSVPVDAEDGLRWEHDGAYRIEDGDGGAVTVVRGVVIENGAAGGDLADTDFGALLFSDGEALDEATLAVVERHVMNAELDWWRMEGADIDALTDDVPAAPSWIYDDEQRTPLTLLFEGHGDDLRVEIFRK